MTDEEYAALGWSVERCDLGLRLSRDNAVLWHADCVDVLPAIPDVDHTITDPPYSELIHKGARTRNQDEILIDFESISTEELLPIVAALVAKSRRWVVMTCDWRHAVEMERMESLVRLGVFVKPNAAPQFSGDRPGTGWEAVAILHRRGKKRWNGGGHHAVWTFNKTEGVHRTQKPLPLVSKWIHQFTDAGESVFDPFMGSGTTGVAAIANGRSFVGVEKDATQFDNAVYRVSVALSERASQGGLTFEYATPDRNLQNGLDFAP